MAHNKAGTETQTIDFEVICAIITYGKIDH